MARPPRKIGAITSPLREWVEGSTSRQILRAATVVVSGTLLVKVVAVAKEMAVASQFGTGDDLDAFLIAFAIPAFVINVVAGSFASAAIPVYAKVREYSPESAKRMLASAIVLGFLILIVVAIGLGVAAEWLLPPLASGFSPEKLEATTRLLRMLLPLVVLGGFAVLVQVALHAENSFGVASVAPMAVPLFSLVAVLAFAPSMGISALVLGVVIGYGLHAMVLVVQLRRQGFPIWPIETRLTPALRSVGSQYAPVVAGGFLMSGTWIVDQAMAAMLPAGSVASLAFGSRLVAVTAGVGTLALGTAALPHFSRLVAREDWEETLSTVLEWTKLIMVVSFVTLLVLVPSSEFLVRTVFERGAFSAADTELVGKIQALYLLQLPFHVAGIMYVRLVSALQANKYLLWGAALNLVVNVVLNLVLMRWLGVAGIALSTSLVYLVSCVFLALVLMRVFPRARRRESLGRDADT